ncbi:MAG: hypothetical protein CMO55_14735 [Verrucomicrobiales bacterium]|nr:hypothetical protein [Verrucomicrobiales bacterium]
MKDAIAKFWREFEILTPKLEDLRTADDPVYDEMLAALQKVDSDLYFEFCSSPGSNEFIVTADGQKKLFPLVEMIVEEAPDMDDWEFFALKPKRGFPVTTRWEQVVVAIEDVSVVPVFRETGEMGLWLYVQGLCEANEGDIHNALLRALDVGLGERRFAEMVVATWVHPASEAPESAFPLSELDEYIDRMESK